MNTALLNRSVTYAAGFRGDDLVCFDGLLLSSPVDDNLFFFDFFFFDDVLFFPFFPGAVSLPTTQSSSLSVRSGRNG
jgi:hypothetical protein